MPRHSVFLGTYSMHITERGSTERVRLHDVDGLGTRFLDWAAPFIDDDVFHNAGSDTEIMRYRRSSFHEEQACAYGLMSCGETGVAEDIVDGATGERGRMKRATEAGMVPHYFQLNAPADTNYAVLALSRLGQRGAYGYFNGPFAEAFRVRFPERVLHIQPSIAPDVLDALRSAPIRAIHFSSVTARSDEFSRLIENDDNSVVFRASITAKRGKSVRLKASLETIWNSLLGSREPVEMPEEWRHFGDRAAITLRVRGKRDRTISVGVGRDVVPYEELNPSTDDFDDKGWPTLSFLHREATTMVSQVRRRERQ